MEFFSAVNAAPLEKAAGPDGFLNEAMKRALDKIFPIFMWLFNLILLTATIPIIWFEATIVSIFKSGSTVTLQTVDLYLFFVH